MPSLRSQLITENWQLTTPLVGRDTELAQLHQWLAKARDGERQLVFITGEPGIGKTTVVDAFLQSLASRVQSLEAERGQSHEENQKAKITSPRPQIPDLWISWGQCIDHHGAGEPYMPVLEALGRLCRAPEGSHFVTLLSQYAPTWLMQMPALLNADELAALQPKVQGATRARMLREMAEALEVLTVERPLVLVLEDLHWSDPSTLDLLALMARRREPARLLVIGTYRPSELLASNHPLRTLMQELQAHSLCAELVLEGLREAAIEEYLDQRFPVRVFPPRLAQVLQQRTGGNPLFLVNLVDDLITRSILTGGEGGWMLQGNLDALAQQVPDSSRQLIAAQMARVSPTTQQTLAAASVAGAAFSAAAVAAALEAPIAAIETQCEEVVRQQLFLQRAGIEAWPDGTTAARYGFRHALYQELWHEQGAVTQRQEWHRRIGLRKELAYNGRAPEIAAELAVHFEQGQEYRKAIQYLQQAGKNAIQRSAHTEAIAHLSKGLELLKMLPDTPERAQQELSLQIALGAPLIVIKGYSASEVEQAYSRARELCQQLGPLPQLFPTLYGLAAFSVVRGELQTAHELSEQLLSLAHNTSDPALLVVAHRALGTTLFYCGEFAPARALFEQSLAVYDPQQHRSLAFRYGADPKGVCLLFLAQTLWYLGYPAQAFQRIQEGLSWTQELAHLYVRVGTLWGIAWLHQHCGDVPAMQARVEEAIALSTEQGFVLLLAMGHTFRGWMLAERGHLGEGITEMNRGFAMYRATKANNLMPYHLALLGEVYGKAGQAENGLVVLAEALEIVDKTGECQREAELYRLKGELTLQSKTSPGQVSGKSRTGRRPVSDKPQRGQTQSETPKPKSQEEAEGYFLKAIEIARKQQAKSLELRAAMSLSRLWQSQGKKKDAHKLLSDIYGWFTEGFDTKDLQEAKALIEELSS